jgi:LmbE family N-acetylglucosaminyl deacetylase
MEKISRRRILKMSAIPAAAAALGFTSISATAGESEKPGKKLKVVVVGAHPDDPETTCGGTMLVLAGEGHEIISAYLTRGEAGITGKTYKEAAKIRTDEALKACKILNARAEFIGQIDGSCEITPKRYTEMTDFLKKEKPDVVFTHWPVDAHRDHRICSILVYDAWIHLNRGFDLYYFEAESGGQTQNFPPSHFIDITSVIEKKHAACYCHVSQDMELIYKEYHELMEKFRGMQANCKFAEAFIKHNQSSLKVV